MYREASRKWAKNNPEKVKENRKKSDEKNKEKRALYRKKYRQEHIDELRERDRLRYQENKEAEVERNRRYRLENKERLENIRALRFYNMTAEEFKSLKERSDGRCNICQVKCRLAIDHCHNSQKVRGLLCRSCNTMLGMAKDNTDVLEKAIVYLTSNK